jgi:hypothetical protein
MTQQAMAPPETSGWRLSSRARKCVLTVHVTASVALIGSSASTVGVALIAAGTEPASDAHALYTAARTLVYALAIPFILTAPSRASPSGSAPAGASCATRGSSPSWRCSWR